MKNFKTIKYLPTEMIDNLSSLKYTEMTAIQEQCIPLILKGKDLIAQAKTGSGKTAAFGIPIVMSIDTDCKDTQALIITPTRELAEQVGGELRRLARFKENIKITVLAGGTPMRGQISSLEKGSHIVVGTPGRLQDHLSRDTLPLYDIKTLVLDEGDRMLDMGFMEAISKIASNLPRKRQTMLFSATFPEKIELLSKQILNNPQRVTIDESHAEDSIAQVAYEVSGDKRMALVKILASHKQNSALIFCNTKIETEDLTDWLHNRGFSAESLNGDLDQRARNEALLMFANGSISVLVATDVASRGLDVKDIELIVNYDLPHDPEIYTHRIGRTGRAGAKGTAVSIYLPQQKIKITEFMEKDAMKSIDSLDGRDNFTMKSKMLTLCIDGGKKDKLRAGDILGTLCKDIGIDGKSIGKIDLLERKSYVAVDRSVSQKALDGIQGSRIKKKKFRAWILQKGKSR